MLSKLSIQHFATTFIIALRTAAQATINLNGIILLGMLYKVLNQKTAPSPILVGEVSGNFNNIIHKILWADRVAGSFSSTALAAPSNLCHHNFR